MLADQPADSMEVMFQIAQEAVGACKAQAWQLPEARIPRRWKEPKTMGWRGSLSLLRDRLTIA